MRIELLLNHRLRPRLLACRLMLGLKLGLAGLADSDDRNILDSFKDPKVALRHEHSLAARVGGHSCPPPLTLVREQARASRSCRSFSGPR